MKKCTGKGCTVRDKCKRHSINPNDSFQSFIYGVPYRVSWGEDGKQYLECGLFIGKLGNEEYIKEEISYN